MDHISPRTKQTLLVSTAAFAVGVGSEAKASDLLWQAHNNASINGWASEAVDCATWAEDPIGCKGDIDYEAEVAIDSGFAI